MSSSNVVKIDELLKLSFKRVVVILPRENIARILRYFWSYFWKWREIRAFS